MELLRLGIAVVRVWPDYLETVFPDGTKVPAAAEHDEVALRKARAWGYGSDTWAMSLDHELAHSWLAVEAGLLCSFTLWRVAHHLSLVAPVVRRLVDEEEEAVKGFHLSVVKGGPRPWDAAAQAGGIR